MERAERHPGHRPGGGRRLHHGQKWQEVPSRLRCRHGGHHDGAGAGREGGGGYHLLLALAIRPLTTHSFERERHSYTE